MHSFWRFSWEFCTSFQVLAGAKLYSANRGSARKYHVMNLQIFNSHSCVLGKIEGSRLVIRICP